MVRSVCENASCINLVEQSKLFNIQISIIASGINHVLTISITSCFNFVSSYSVRGRALTVLAAAASSSSRELLAVVQTSIFVGQSLPIPTIAIGIVDTSNHFQSPP